MGRKSLALNETYQLCVLKNQKSSFAGGGEDAWEAENGVNILKDVNILYPP